MATQIAYPVKVEAKLSEHLSRWLWLVKWFLLIPHYFVLAFLWLAFVAMSVAAFFAILFSARYPRAIFDFNVGVLRWSWRVAYYAYGALGTDRYPPFTLHEVADYPTHLEITYPERLSRVLVLMKWWLLALPHYLVVGVLMGGTWIVFSGEGWEVGGFGLIELLTVVAGVVLAFTGAYPKPVFDMLLGFNRWVLRVAAYAALMTDVYPPFRLDMGGDEPRDTAPLPADDDSPSASRPDMAGAPLAASNLGWTMGPILALSVGALIALTSLGVLGAGGVALWADTTQRDDGFVTSPVAELGTDSYAVVSESIEIYTEGPDWALPEDVVGDARVRVSSPQPIFVGIASSADVERYLGSVSHAVVNDLVRQDGLTLPGSNGGPPASEPDDNNVWVASSQGRGMRTITWPVTNGEWSLVVMNADGSRDVQFEGDVGAEAPALRPIAVGLLGGGVVLLLIAVALIAGAIARAARSTESRR